ncbi:MAG: hypothetical protein MRJ92_07090 [Nitrospira sp.]|nr:hypothetical protein [Nitrospira sp.]
MDRPSQADSTRDTQTDLHAQQVYVLYRNMPTGVLASAANAAILAAVEWSVVPIRRWWRGFSCVVAHRRTGHPDLPISSRRSLPTGAAQTGTAGCWPSTTAAGVAWGVVSIFWPVRFPLPYELVHLFVLGA